MSNDTHPAPLSANESAMFERGDCVRHMKSMRLYVIVQSPPIAIDEPTGQPRYIYRSADLHDPRWWIRAQHVMEDGRFVMHKKAQLI